MPEEVEADQAVHDLAAEAFHLHLRQHGAEPEEARAHVKAVRSHEREEAGEKAAALRNDPLLR